MIELYDNGPVNNQYTLIITGLSVHKLRRTPLKLPLTSWPVSEVLGESQTHYVIGSRVLLMFVVIGALVGISWFLKSRTKRNSKPLLIITFDSCLILKTHHSLFSSYSDSSEDHFEGKKLWEANSFHSEFNFLFIAPKVKKHEITLRTTLIYFHSLSKSDRELNRTNN